MADLTVTRHRRYRVGNLTLCLMRVTGIGAGVGDSVPFSATRLSKVFGAVGSMHTVGIAAQPSWRIALNRIGSAQGSTARGGDLGITAGTGGPNATIIAIGR